MPTLLACTVASYGHVRTLATSFSAVHASNKAESSSLSVHVHSSAHAVDHDDTLAKVAHTNCVLSDTASLHLASQTPRHRQCHAPDDWLVVGSLVGAELVLPLHPAHASLLLRYQRGAACLARCRPPAVAAALALLHAAEVRRRHLRA